jgi:hypothetical protein
MSARLANPDDKVMEQVMQTLRACIAGAARNGEASCYWQGSWTPGQEASLEENRLAPDAARRQLAAKVRSGFEGIVLFASLVDSTLVVEGYDTRDGVSASASTTFKRTMFGKLKQTSDGSTIGRSADLLVEAIDPHGP